MRGRDAARGLRQVRADAVAATVLTVQIAHDGKRSDLVETELTARRRVRGLALVALALLTFVAVVLAPHLATQIGVDLTPPRGAEPGWLAGQLDDLGSWWAERSTNEKIIVGAGLAALIALSGGSLSLAVGVSGAGIYLADHAKGAAALVRDPDAAVRSWLATTTPADAVLDVGEFALTFTPGNFVGAVAGRKVRAFAGHAAADAVHGPPPMEAVPKGLYAPRAAADVHPTDPRGLMTDADKLWSQADQFALNDYTGAGYEAINHNLRKGTVTPGSSMDQRIEAISAAIAKLPMHEGVVYRGTSLTPTQLERYVNGESLPETAFTSASRDSAVLTSRSTQFTILSSAGRDVASYSLHPWEQEVLFDHGTWFHVLGRTEDDVTGVTEIYMMEVPPR